MTHLHFKTTNNYKIFVLINDSYIMDCSICHGKYQDPISIDCGHSFCRRCIYQWTDIQRINQRDATCPFCNQNFYLPSKNYALAQFIEEHDKCMAEIDPIMRSNDKYRQEARKKDLKIAAMEKQLEHSCVQNHRLMKQNRALFNTSIQRNMFINGLKRQAKRLKGMLDQGPLRLPVRPYQQMMDTAIPVIVLD